MSCCADKRPLRLDLCWPGRIRGKSLAKQSEASIFTTRMPIAFGHTGLPVGNQTTVGSSRSLLVLNSVPASLVLVVTSEMRMDG